jgi:hypothetical protein
MWIFVILSLTDIYIFWRLVADMKLRSKALQALVFTVKAILSLILLYFIVRLLSYRGEFADPANAFRYIVFGALAALIITVGSLYLVTGADKYYHLRSAVVPFHRQLPQTTF